MKFSHRLVLVLSTVAVFFAPIAPACENEYESGPMPRSHAEAFPGAGYVNYLQGKHEGEVFSPEEKLAIFEKSGDFRDESNYAVALMRTGKHQEARDLFKRLAEEHPDEYIIAANLGTAFELTGDNEQALAWIRKGMQLNPESHAGTEWLHVKILQAKLSAEKDSSWFDKNSVLSLNFGDQPEPTVPAELERDDAGQPLTLQKIREALEYQLHERLFYVKPKDVVVASLLETLANILLLEERSEVQLEKAYRVFVLARDYSSQPSKLLEQKIKAHNPFDKTAQFLASHPPVPVLAAVVPKSNSRSRFLILGTTLVTVVGMVFAAAFVLRGRRTNTPHQ